MQPHRGGYSNNGAPGQGYGERATGNVKALFIGINYVGQNGQLRGCVNDVKTIQKVLKAKGISNGSYQEVVLVDEQKGEFRGAKHPTKKEILQSFKWLSSNNRPGDTLFLHYSGHGGQQRDHDGDEQDGYDETICPVDYASAGQITDDEIYKLLVTPLPSGVRMTAIMDCCHSGTAMDLPFEFKADGGSMRSALSDPGSMAMYGIGRGKKMKKEKKAKKEKKGKKEKKEKKEKKDKKDKKNKYYDDDDDDDDDAPLTHHSMAGNSDGQGADVIMFSGCADSQTSADVSGPQGAGGACTNSFSAVLLGQSNLRFVDLLEQMRQDLKKKRYTQIPQLSSTKPVDLNAVFSFFGPVSKSRAAPRDAPPAYDYQPPVPVFLQGIAAPYAQQGAFPPPQGAPNQFPPQGQYPPQGPPQGQYPPQGPPQGQHPPHGQYPAQGPPQGQYPPHGQYPPQGPPQGQYPPQGPPQGQHPPHGQYPPQGAPGQYPPQGQYPPGPGNHHMLPHGQNSNESV